MNHFRALSCLLLLVSGLALPAAADVAASSEGAGGGTFTDELAEAVALSKLRPQDAAGTCLVVAGADPSPALLVRLRVQLPGLRPGSECRYVAEAGSDGDDRFRDHEVRDRDGSKARFLRLSLADGATADAATVSYEWDAGSWTGHGGAVIAERRDGAWHVTQPNDFEWVE